MSRNGQAVLEFTMMLPIMASFMALLVEFGLVMYVYVAVANGPREGARYASLNCTPEPGDPAGFVATCTATKVKDRVLARTPNVLTDPNEVDVWWCRRSGSTSATPVRGDSVRVRVDHTHAFLFFPGQSIRLLSQVDMLIEEDDPNDTTMPQGPTANRPC